MANAPKPPTAPPPAPVAPPLKAEFDPADLDTPPLPSPPKAPAAAKLAIVDCYQHGITEATPWGGLTVVLDGGQKVFVGKELFKSARWAGKDDPVGN